MIKIIIIIVIIIIIKIINQKYLIIVANNKVRSTWKYCNGEKDKLLTNCIRNDTNWPMAVSKQITMSLISMLTNSLL
jgi:hypothetical protein